MPLATKLRPQWIEQRKVIIVIKRGELLIVAIISIKRGELIIVIMAIPF
jgi:hypothetical protein